MDVEEMQNSFGKLKIRKTYGAPTCRRVSPGGAAKVLFSQHAAIIDTEFQPMIESFDHLHGEKGS